MFHGNYLYDIRYSLFNKTWNQYHFMDQILIKIIKIYLIPKFGISHVKIIKIYLIPHVINLIKILNWKENY